MSTRAGRCGQSETGPRALAPAMIAQGAATALVGVLAGLVGFCQLDTWNRSGEVVLVLAAFGGAVGLVLGMTDAAASVVRHRRTVTLLGSAIAVVAGVVCAATATSTSQGMLPWNAQTLEALSRLTRNEPVGLELALAISIAAGRIAAGPPTRTGARATVLRTLRGVLGSAIPLVVPLLVANDVSAIPAIFSLAPSDVFYVGLLNHELPYVWVAPLLLGATLALEPWARVLEQRLFGSEDVS